MVDPQRSRYVTDNSGAPPVPPPGGYHGARRHGVDPLFPLFPTAAVTTVDADPPRKPASAIGWIALVGSILFAVILLGALLAGSTDLLYSATMLALQLVVFGVIIAALFSPRGRMLGASALIITLLLNVATVGAMSALQTSASGTYQGEKSAAQRLAEAFPGVKDTPSGAALSQPSLEQVRTRSETALAAVRARLTEEFGYTWTETAPEVLRPERNGYGGESMLVQYSSPTWITNEPVHDYAQKLEVMAAIQQVLYAHGMYDLYSFNDPSSGLDASILQRFYGSTDPRTQHTWEWYTDNYPDPMRFYAVLYDLSQDPTGELRTEREAEVATTGGPLEGLQISILAPQLLSEADRAEFEERMKDYPGY